MLIVACFIACCMAFAKAGPAFGAAQAVAVDMGAQPVMPGFDSTNNGHGLDMGQQFFDADHTINDKSRYEDQANTLRGTWSISGQGTSERPRVDEDCNLVEDDDTNQVATVDVEVAFIGLVCFDGKFGCSLELQVQTDSSTFIVKSRYHNCYVALSPEGQGYIDAQLETVFGCDAQGVFPKRFVASFVVGHDGELDFTLTGCPFGIEADLAKHHKTELNRPGKKDVFRCASLDNHGLVAGDQDRGNNVEDLVPILASGEIERQNGRNKVKSGHGGPIPMAASTDASSSTSAPANGATSVGTSQPSQNDETCDGFATFRYPFAVNNGNNPQCGSALCPIAGVQEFDD